jgi:hypothetical protein
MNAKAIIVALAFFAAPALSWTDQDPPDIPRLYAEVAGGYEFYLDQRYLVISVSVDQGKLWARAPGDPKAQEMRPVDLAGLKFTIDDPGKDQSAVFVRDRDGKISALRLVSGGRENVGLRVPLSGRAPRQVDMPFAAEDLRADLLQIRRSLEETHPAVYGFTGKEAFDRLYEAQLAALDGPKTLGEFYAIAAPLVAAVGCGHTALLIPADYWQTAPPRFFPLALRIVGGRAYVVRDADPAETVRPGTEVMSINGRSAAGILKDLQSIVSSDGSNDGYKTARVNARFPYLYATRYGFPEEFVVEALPPDRPTVQTLRLRSVERSRIPTGPAVEKPATSSGNPGLDFRILPDAPSAAVLTIRTFDYYQETDKFKGFIDESFDRLRRAGVRDLILDLRGNGGGDPFCTTHLLGYLEPRPVPYFARVYPTPYERFAEPIPRAAGAFDGRLFILTDARCFSSTGHLGALLKYHRIGTFIGAETGGTYECNDARREIHLEKTRLLLAVARIAFTAAVQGLPRYRGIVPDIAVEPGLADILAGRDPVLERALSLIARKGGV